MQVADLAAAPLTVSEARHTAVDFTVPYMSFGLEILMKKPRAGNKNTPDSSLPTISSVKDLARQTDIKYGVIAGGRTEDFFRRSKDEDYKLMWREMNSNRGFGLVPSNLEGVRLVNESDGRYAFILEGPTAKYWAQKQPCDMVSVEGGADNRHYALAVRRGSPLKEKLDDALKQMDNGGELDKLYQKWWIERSECGRAADRFIGAGWSLVIALLTALMVAAFPLL